MANIFNYSINQLPELVIPKNRTFTSISNMTVASTTERRNPYITKWYVLFDNRHEQWISFQPQSGHTVYPCYACRDMFGSRNSFLDHVNRRGMVLKYACSLCKKSITFYNTCSFLLHAREHFTEAGGVIDLDCVEISTIAMNIAGFMPVPNIPRIYDTLDDTTNYTLKLSVKFFKPSEDCIGKKIVTFVPNDLLFFCSTNKNNNPRENQVMILTQVNRNIPKCVFIQMSSGKKTEAKPLENRAGDFENRRLNSGSESGGEELVISEEESDVICLDDDVTSDELSTKSTHDGPKIQVKNLNQLLSKHFTNFGHPDRDRVCIIRKCEKVAKLPDCPECKETMVKPLIDHFLSTNRPVDDNTRCNKCGLVSPSSCSLQAHIRIHDKKSPYICPECGKSFDVWSKLSRHMEDVCFHTAKNVRYKCPAKKCGKVFAQTMTFTAHFPLAHMKVRISCSVCSNYFINEIDFKHHLTTVHNDQSDNLSYKKINECAVCIAPVSNVKDHVLTHIQANDNRIYVYICKYCRSYYRSKQTYAAHLLRCAKLLLNTQVKKEVERIESDMKCKVVKYCRPCSSKIQFYCMYKDIGNVSTSCPQCSTPFSSEVSIQNKSFSDYEYTDNDFVRKDAENDVSVCLLCDKVLSESEITDYFKHSCRYRNPIVIVDILNTSSESLDSLIRSDLSPGSDDSSKRKRKRFFNGSIKNKRNSASTERSEDSLTADPVLFDGEYKCKLCRFRNESRKLFHDHIQEHRDISTSYQCMECGECFVVKPSLLKHLQVFHLIENVETYMDENECFDREAVRLLEENMRMIPGEVNEPVADNQCRICRQMFTDEIELSKHFRVHGMAFLMKKIIK